MLLLEHADGVLFGGPEVRHAKKHDDCREVDRYEELRAHNVKLFTSCKRKDIAIALYVFALFKQVN